MLLRNRNGVLPLSPRVGSIAVIGHDAGAGTQIEENGSPAVLHGPVITPLAGIRRLVGSRSRITYAPGTLGVVAAADHPRRARSRPTGGTGHGLSARYYTGQTPSGTPVANPRRSHRGLRQQTGAAGHHPRNAERQRRRVDGHAHPAADRALPVLAAGRGRGPALPGRSADRAPRMPSSPAPTCPAGSSARRARPTITFQGLARLTKDHRVSIRVTYATGSSIAGAALQVGWQPPDPSMLARAVRAARHAKVAIVFANDVTSEGMDRTSLQLPGDQDRLIEAVAAANPRTVVVLHTAGPVLMPWLSKVAGVLEAWYPGQQSGAAIAATLFGDSDPVRPSAGHVPADGVAGPRPPTRQSIPASTTSRTTPRESSSATATTTAITKRPCSRSGTASPTRTSRSDGLKVTQARRRLPRHGQAAQHRPPWPGPRSYRPTSVPGRGRRAAAPAQGVRQGVPDAEQSEHRPVGPAPLVLRVLERRTRPVDCRSGALPTLCRDLVARSAAQRDDPDPVKCTRGSTWIFGPEPDPGGRPPASTPPTSSSPTVAATSGRGSIVPLA